jgi:glutathione S-transferase
MGETPIPPLEAEPSLAPPAAVGVSWRPFMKLFGHDTSPYVRRVRVLLAELGVPFERDVHGWQDAVEEMLRRNPLMRVPVLVDEARGDQMLVDSKLMAAYLYEHSAAAPAAPAGHVPLQPTLFREGRRYDDENVLLVVDGALDSAINVFLMERDGVLPAASSYLERQQHRVERCLIWLERAYDGRTTLGDGVVSFTDLSVVCALDWMTFRKRYDVTRHPALCGVAERHRDRPSLAATHPSQAVHVLK